MAEANKPALSRAVEKILRGRSKPTPRGTLEFTEEDITAAAGEVADNVILRPVKQDEEEEYDPVKHGQELAKKQLGERDKPDSAAWR